jgi:hypothetical protein|tara:strand:- start:220 stop:1455 length:1236 start_codon:yes stop_codon:yes gene_type:complete
MQGFQKYLIEDRNTHLEHLEDEIINNGTKGAKTSIEFLKSIKKMLQGGSGGSTVSVKWDGAPAVFCGINPENGKFFVGTKSIFNVTPKINYTNSDIDKNHGGALADKLKTALKYLPSLGIKGVLQGDLLFTDDKKRAKVAGKDSIVFTPNTITYAVPKVSSGFLGLGRNIYTEIDNAKIGIIFHTSYSGKTMRSMRASFGASVRGLRKNKNVFFDDAKYKQVGNAGFDKNEESRFEAIIRMAEGSAYKAGKFVDLLKKDKGPLSLGVQMKTFFNTYIRQGTPIANTSKLANNFEVYFRDRLKKEIDSKKTPAAKQKYKEILEVGMKILRPNRDGLYFTIATYITLQTAKALLLGKLNQIQSIGSFLRTKNGYRVTNPEGYVAIKRGGAVKLVDRLEFSKANFTMAKDWVKG